MTTSKELFDKLDKLPKERQDNLLKLAASRLALETMKRRSSKATPKPKH